MAGIEWRHYTIEAVRWTDEMWEVRCEGAIIFHILRSIYPKQPRLGHKISTGVQDEPGFCLHVALGEATIHRWYRDDPEASGWLDHSKPVVLS